MATLVLRYDFRMYLSNEESVMTHPTTPPSILDLAKKDDTVFPVPFGTSNLSVWDDTISPIVDFDYAFLLAEGTDLTLELYNGTTTFSITLTAGVPFILGSNGALRRFRVSNASVDTDATLRRFVASD